MFSSKKMYTIRYRCDVSSSEIRDGKKLHLIDKKIQKRVRDEYRIREKS